MKQFNSAYGGWETSATLEPSPSVFFLSIEHQVARKTIINAILGILHSLEEVHIDGSVLVKTGIVKVVKRLVVGKPKQASSVQLHLVINEKENGIEDEINGDKSGNDLIDGFNEELPSRISASASILLKKWADQVYAKFNLLL